MQNAAEMALLAVACALGCGDEAGDALDGGAGAGASAATSGGASAGGAGGAGAGGPGGQGTGGAGDRPRIGAHGLSFYEFTENGFDTIATPTLSTQPSGSTLIVAAGRGDGSAFALPTDNMGNRPYLQLGTSHPYTNYPGSGTAVYAFVGASGGPGHVISNSTPPYDEITFAAVEVTGSRQIQDFQWGEVLNGQPLTSPSVTTTGPAVLVALWWGDAGVDSEKVAVPNNDFVVLDSLGQAGEIVQCFVAAKEVEVAGTYDVTWTATPQQGAQLWLVAVQ